MNFSFQRPDPNAELYGRGRLAVESRAFELWLPVKVGCRHSTVLVYSGQWDEADMRKETITSL